MTIRTLEFGGWGFAGLWAAIVWSWAPPHAAACGGFFCSQQPVDQSAEVVVFAVGAESTTMVVQIQYQGAAPDFAWVLPLPAVPNAQDLATFPALGLSALNAQTSPQFQYPSECLRFGPLAAPNAATDRAGAGGTGGGEVTVHVRQTVGPYDTAVVESTDPAALVAWLRDNDYRVTQPMEPYIARYTEEGMKFLALRLTRDADVTDIAPFSLTLPGQVPTLPLRMTALAAEPEMGILVFVFGDQRYTPANWAAVEVDERRLTFRPDVFPIQTNWTTLVAEAVDAVGGQGFVTEVAEPMESYRQRVERGAASSPEQMEAREALLGLMGNHRYLTRLYTRLSPGEMISDPSFRRSDGPDVSRQKELPRFTPDGRDQCEVPVDPHPCSFLACGAGGLCRITEAGVAACACIPGATARAALSPEGQVAVSCVDMRLSFLNPGDREAPGAAPLPDPCVGYDCGLGGECVPMNMTPTCRCGTGKVAVGEVGEDGARRVRCAVPGEAIPDDFDNRRLPALPTELPGGRTVDTPPVAGGLCAVGGAAFFASPSTPALPLFALAASLLAFILRRRR